MSKPRKEIKTLADLADAVKEKILGMTIKEALKNSLIYEILFHRGDIEDKIDKAVTRPLEDAMKEIDEHERPIKIARIAERMREEGIL